MMILVGQPKAEEHRCEEVQERRCWGTETEPPGQQGRIQGTESREGALEEGCEEGGPREAVSCCTTKARRINVQQHTGDEGGKQAQEEREEAPTAATQQYFTIIPSTG